MPFGLSYIPKSNFCVKDNRVFPYQPSQCSLVAGPIRVDTSVCRAEHVCSATTIRPYAVSAKQKRRFDEPTSTAHQSKTCERKEDAAVSFWRCSKGHVKVDSIFSPFFPDQWGGGACRLVYVIMFYTTAVPKTYLLSRAFERPTKMSVILQQKRFPYSMIHDTVCIASMSTQDAKHQQNGFHRDSGVALRRATGDDRVRATVATAGPDSL